VRILSLFFFYREEEKSYSSIDRKYTVKQDLVSSTVNQANHNRTTTPANQWAESDSQSINFQPQLLTRKRLRWHHFYPRARYRIGSCVSSFNKARKILMYSTWSKTNSVFDAKDIVVTSKWCIRRYDDFSLL